MKLAFARALLIVAGAGAQAALAQEGDVRLPPVTVIGVTPLPGFGLPADEVPANVQLFGPADLARSSGRSLPDVLERRAASVATSSGTGNPFQSDVLYRGFAASPLLGTPQGLSVFLDGVRINEVFGDVVNWDLVPTQALANAALVPGSNPVFGLNTLGGALTLETKDGAAHPGGEASVGMGSFGRRSAVAEYGARLRAFDAYVTADAMRERGWREHASSRVQRAFAKLGADHQGGRADLTLQLADTRLEGTQALPLSMLDAPREAYTWPDGTRNRLAAATLRARHDVAADHLVSAQFYGRRLRTDAFNSNVNAEADAGEDTPAASNVRGTAVNDAWGASVQWSLRTRGPLGMHRVSAGAALDAGSTVFDQSNTPAIVTAARETVDAGVAEPTTAARADVRQVGAYALDSIAIGERATLMVSGRFQQARIDIRDRSGTAPELDGRHRFSRFNPALGGTYAIGSDASAYANWSRGMRVPTAMELTCADPDAPCSLPNIFVADPPLRPVLASTIEAGIRRRSAQAAFSAAIYRTRLADDIQFIASAAGAGSAGYFTNVGATERRGVELTAWAHAGAFAVDLRYGYTRAVFRSSFTTHSPANAEAGPDGSITVASGNRIPGIPAHAARVRLEWRANDAWLAAAGWSAVSSQFARGNENNADPAGRVPGYATVDVELRWTHPSGWQIEGAITNLLDRRYSTFGTLGTNLFRGPGNTYAPELAAAEPFLVPAPPRAAWLAVHYRFGRT